MIYLNADHLRAVGTHWNHLIAEITATVHTLAEKDFSQPVKPYLRYRDPRNRIIAMPAYVGGHNPLAGIKWIASFPENIHHGIPRAHSVTVLNEPDSGRPVCLLNTPMVSAIRTAAVSAFVLEKYVESRPADKRFRIGIIGFGPIGQMHLRMILAVLDGRIEEVSIFDLRPIAVPSDIVAPCIRVTGSWQECYHQSDIFITCTVADRPYISEAPPKGSLQMNVSLRDYQPQLRRYMDLIIVDDWDEVCRQNTDIENMHKLTGLQRDDVVEIDRLAYGGGIASLDDDAIVMFNPMGMAVFDIAIGGYYCRQCLDAGIGIVLPD